MKQRNIIFAVSLLLVSHIHTFALTQKAVGEYWDVAEGRAVKIVDNLDLDDPGLEAQLVEAVAGQYRDLFVIHEMRDEAIRALQPYDHGFDDFTQDARRGIEEAAAKAIRKAHRAYVATLTALAGGEVANAIKDGMTYNVAQNTYNVYMQMLPDLEQEHRDKIKAWLYEAREYAIDGGSSDEKHRWFGKYKGRINNYLSALGVDLKAAERAMWGRMKEEQKN